MLKKAGIVLTLVATLAAASGAGAWVWVSRAGGEGIAAMTKDVAPARAGLVLGTAPRALSGRPNLFFTRRMDAAAALFMAGKVDYLIVSGNQANGGAAKGGYDEPTAMRDALVAKGVPAARIYRDYAGFHTLDSILRAKDIFGQDDAVVISQRFHVERALYLARARGLAFTGFAANDVPGFYGARTKAREAVSRIVALFYAATGAGPRLGGPKVVIGQDPPT